MMAHLCVICWFRGWCKRKCKHYYHWSHF